MHHSTSSNLTERFATASRPVDRADQHGFVEVGRIPARRRSGLRPVRCVRRSPSELETTAALATDDQPVGR
jgi:hypothetical protein